MFYQIKTVLLIAFLNALFLVVGHAISGTTGLIFALTFALVINFVIYYYSEHFALKAFNARKMSEEQYPHIYEMVSELSQSANLPMPKLWIIDNDMANAFATGRNPQNSSIAVTTGILKILNRDELRGVLAHEMSHILNRDILITTTAAVVVAAMSLLIDAYRWRMFWGSNNSKEKNNSFIIYLLIIILTPLLAMLLQFALSRTREFLADDSGAKLSHSPLDLASALQKLENYTQSGHTMSDDAGIGQKAFSSLFFCSPFKGAGGWFLSIFSTHPSTKERVRRLENLKL